MLSEERIEEIANEVAAPVSRYLPYWRTSVDFARAIEAAVLPESWVLVPRIVTPAIEAVYSNDSGAYGTAQELHNAMLAAAPKPAQDCDMGELCIGCSPRNLDGTCPDAAQASPLDLMECLQDRPVEPSKAVQGKCVGQAEKQEPVKDAPVAWRFSKGTITKLDSCPHGGNWQPLYTRPQSDLTAEVERLKLSAEHWNRLYRERCQEFHDAQANKGQEIVWLIDRIAELEEAARKARDAFEQHDGNYKLSKASGAVVEEAIAKLDAVLGNAD